MNALADYGSSSGEEEEEEGSVGIRLPQPTKRTQAKVSTDDVLDSTVKPHDWELREAPKPTPKLRKKVIIALPELAQDDSDEDEDAPKAVKPSAPPKGSTKLLSMLPAPTTSKGAGLVMPKPLGRIDTGAKATVKSTTTTSSMVPHALRKKKVAVKEKEEEEEDVLPANFFNISSELVPSAALADTVIEEEPVDDEYALPAEVEYVQTEPEPQTSLIEPLMRTPLDTAVDIHPSQMYNLAAGPSTMEQDYYAQQTRSGFTEEQTQQIIYKNETEAWGKLRPSGGGSLEIRDVNVAAALGNVRETILKNMAYRAPADMPSMDAFPGKKKRKGEDEPDKMAKRKHQITYLAHQAKLREDSLKDQWAANKYSRRQTQQKYGF